MNIQLQLDNATKNIQLQLDNATTDNQLQLDNTTRKLQLQLDYTAMSLQLQLDNSPQNLQHQLDDLARIFQLQLEILTFIAHHRVSLWPTLTKTIPNTTILEPTRIPTNHVRVHVTLDHEHSCHDKFTLYKGCTHSPLVVI
jgi:hypothetical protein